MQIQTIRLTDFRNYETAEIEKFTAGTNIICGENAQGKTNLLEAIYTVCRGRSFRTRSASESIRFDAKTAEIFAEIEQNGRIHTAEMTIDRNERKRIRINGAEQKTITELPFYAVLFRPEDLEIGRGAAAIRRRWLDVIISAIRPRYADALTEHRKLYDSKLKLLKDIRDNPSLSKVLEDFDILLAKADAVLIHYRALFCRRIAPLIAENAAKLSGESLTAVYRAVTSIPNPEELKPSEICVKLLERQSELRTAELASGNVLSGARKDDFYIQLNGLTAEFWSQGQARTVAVAMKLAEREFLKQETGEYPILLLDDVLSDLDEPRRFAVLNKLGEGQTFITCCDTNEIFTRGTANSNGKWRVENGKIRAE